MCTKNIAKSMEALGTHKVKVISHSPKETPSMDLNDSELGKGRAHAVVSVLVSGYHEPTTGRYLAVTMGAKCKRAGTLHVEFPASWCATKKLKTSIRHTFKLLHLGAV